jgi:hypothetical protein
MPTLTSLRLASVAALLVLLAGCTTTNVPISNVQLPLGSDTPVALPQQNDQTLRATILDGKFDSTIYQEQSGATQMLVISTGGPYLFSIDRLVNRRELPPNGAVVINYDTSSPGQFTMRAYLSTPDGTGSEVATAVLDIAPPGGR